jgi:hypothetical protein
MGGDRKVKGWVLCNTLEHDSNCWLFCMTCYFLKIAQLGQGRGLVAQVVQHLPTCRRPGVWFPEPKKKEKKEGRKEGRNCNVCNRNHRSCSASWQ